MSEISKIVGSKINVINTETGKIISSKRIFKSNIIRKKLIQYFKEYTPKLKKIHSNIFIHPSNIKFIIRKNALEIIKNDKKLYINLRHLDFGFIDKYIKSSCNKSVALSEITNSPLKSLLDKGVIYINNKGKINIKGKI